MSNNLNVLGKNLTTNATVMRKEAEMNLSQLAHFTGVSRRTLSRIEAAKKARKTYNPMLKTAIKLAAVAGVTVDEFISGKLVFK
jgi:DNA-binding XRE family transcriptional regulator